MTSLDSFVASAMLHCDRGYISSPIVAEVIAQGGEIVCKPWVSHNTKN